MRSLVSSELLPANDLFPGPSSAKGQRLQYTSGPWRRRRNKETERRIRKGERKTRGRGEGDVKKTKKSERRKSDLPRAVGPPSLGPSSEWPIMYLR